RVDADVRGQKPRLELFDRVLVERLVTEPEQVRREPRLAAIQALLELREEAGALLRLGVCGHGRDAPGEVAGEIVLLVLRTCPHPATPDAARRAAFESSQASGAADAWPSRRIPAFARHRIACARRCSIGCKRRSSARAFSISTRGRGRWASSRCRAEP